MKGILAALAAVAVTALGCDEGRIVRPDTPAASQFSSLAVTPTTTVLTVGASYQLGAVPLDQVGAPMTGLPAATFTSSDSATASVSPTGVVGGVKAGLATITATLTVGAVTRSATCVVTVTAPGGGGLTVTTPDFTFSPATVTIPEGASVTWQFSGATHNVWFQGAAPTGGNIPDQAPGNAVSRTFPAAGSYPYECTRHSGMTGQVVVTGTQAPVFTTLTVIPATPSILVAGTVQLTATPLDQNAVPMTGLPAPGFTTSAAGIASVNATGVVTGVAAGTATITATLTAGGETRSATAAVTVTAPQPSAVTVTTPNLTFSPATVTIPVGGTVTWQFSGSTHNVSFQGAAPTGGDIPDQSPGNAVSRTFPTAGNYPYECTRHSGMTGQVIVSGGGNDPPVYTSLSLVPAIASVPVGATLQLAATPLDQYGGAMTGTPAATFTSSDSATVTVTAGGLVTGLAAGTVTVTAALTAGGVTHTAGATVTVTTGNAVIVSTDGDRFTPEDVFLTPGGTVTWQFSGATHNVTFTDEAPPGGDIADTAAGQAVSRTFPQAGDYDYECTRHAGMKGRVRVR